MTPHITSCCPFLALPVSPTTPYLARSLDKLEDVQVIAADVRDFNALQRAVKEAGVIDVLIVIQCVFVPREPEKQGLDLFLVIIKSD